MAYIKEALERIREESDTQASTGRTFEELVADAFRSHPTEWGADRFAEVWTWADWPGRKEAGFDGRDIGIDLVAEQTPAWGGGLCAIQCKLYRGEVPTKGVDSFLAAAPENIFKDALLVASAPLSITGHKKLENRKGGHVLYTAEMDPWIPDWREAVPRKRKVEAAAEPPKTPLPHQREALDDIREGWDKGHRRGQLILPCGTGKTLTSLWAATEATEPGDTILFLVPSLALMSQTMTEWSANKTVPLQFLAVCSDTGVGKKMEGRRLSELFAEVTTSPEEIRAALDAPIPEGFRRAVFCTYQSSPVLAEVSEGREFAMAIFDEAHRTTGVDVDPEGAFQTALHDDKVSIRRRLFMTATPRIFTELQKKNVEEGYYDGESYMMDDKEVYGEEFYHMNFRQAIEKKLLSDYQIHVVAVGDTKELAIAKKAKFKWDDLKSDFQPRGKKGIPALLYNDALRLAGCWDALATPYSKGTEPGHVTGKLNSDLGEPAATALLYANTVRRSEEVAQVWAALVAHEALGKEGEFLELVVDHMDGGTPADRRSEQLNRLRKASERRQRGRCEIISNARVLTEGVDVPGLDAVIFLDARSSDVEVTQAVGRAMRTADDKKEGHVIIPVLVASGDDAHQGLTKSSYSKLSQVIRGLRAHDGRWDYWLSDPTLCGERVKPRFPGGGEAVSEVQRREIEALAFDLTEKVASEMVSRCGDRKMWPNWGKRAGAVAARVKERLRDEIYRSTEVNRVFQGMCDDFSRVGIFANPDEVQEMVAHHIVIMPIFDAMFDDRFSQDNPISKGISKVLVALEEAGVSFEQERAELERPYRRMKEILEAAEEDSQGDPFHKADVIRQIYDGFLADAKGMAEEVRLLGMVYTPQWIVDFMLRSVDAVCRKHFGTAIDEGVRFLDPFAGTGIFPTRLLAARRGDGEFLVSDGRLEEMWGNLYGGEIMMLPYYAAALGTEEVYRRRLWMRDGADPGYQPWPGLVLQDSMLTEEGQCPLDGLGENTRRAAKVAGTPVDVICTNPPWLEGKKREGEVGKREYPKVRERIRATYTKKIKEMGISSGGSTRGNLWVHSMRWATDRLQEGDGAGKVLAMVHPESLLKAPSQVVMRACLSEDFTDIYVINLRGESRTRAKKPEGQNVFESRNGKGGTQSGVQITVLVRDPQRAGERARVRLAECDDYMGRDDKREWLEQEVRDVTSHLLKDVAPRSDYSWGKPPDPLWEKMVTLEGDKYMDHSRSFAPGIQTGGDQMFVSMDPDALAERMERLLSEYGRLLDIVRSSDSKPSKAKIDNLCSDTPLRPFSKMKDQLRQGKEITFDPSYIIPILYRPFVSRFLYADFRILRRYSVGLREWTAGREIICTDRPAHSPGWIATDLRPNQNALGPGQIARCWRR